MPSVSARSRPAAADQNIAEPRRRQDQRTVRFIGGFLAKSGAGNGVVGVEPRANGDAGDGLAFLGGEVFTQGGGHRGGVLAKYT